MTPPPNPRTAAQHLRDIHVRIIGNTFEPDPADPSQGRRTEFCIHCAENANDDARWPCLPIQALIEAEADRDEALALLREFLTITQMQKGTGPLLDEAEELLRRHDAQPGGGG